jgi:hypothetical protein
VSAKSRKQIRAMRNANIEAGRLLSYQDAKARIIQLQPRLEAQARAINELYVRTGGTKFISPQRVAEIVHETRQAPAVLTEQLMQNAIETVRAMDSDQKAHLRAKLSARLAPYLKNKSNEDTIQ